jgi:hypothetical protein
MTQLMDRAKIFLGQSDPPFPVNGRPKIAAEAPAQMLTVVVNLG